MKTQCPFCTTIFEIDKEYIGRKSQCPQCLGIFFPAPYTDTDIQELSEQPLIFYQSEDSEQISSTGLTNRDNDFSNSISSEEIPSKRFLIKYPQYLFLGIFVLTLIVILGIYVFRLHEAYEKIVKLETQCEQSAIAQDLQLQIMREQYEKKISDQEQQHKIELSTIQEKHQVEVQEFSRKLQDTDVQYQEEKHNSETKFHDAEQKYLQKIATLTEQLRLAESHKQEDAVKKHDQNTLPSRLPSNSHAATSSIEVFSITITGSFDGSGEFYFSGDKIFYRHKAFQYPTDVSVNGKRWNNLKKNPTFTLPRSLKSLRLNRRGYNGRGTISWYMAENGLILQIDDHQSGADQYKIWCTFSAP